MRFVARLISAAALLGTILPSVLYLNGSIDLDRTKWIMLVATIVWFIVAPLADRQTRLEAIVEDSGGEVVP